ncbi:hypothetical protein Holit_03166 [Hollandina sp. SP2]
MHYLGTDRGIVVCFVVEVYDSPVGSGGKVREDARSGSSGAFGNINFLACPRSVYGVQAKPGPPYLRRNAYAVGQAARAVRGKVRRQIYVKT